MNYSHEIYSEYLPVLVVRCRYVDMSYHTLSVDNIYDKLSVDNIHDKTCILMYCTSNSNVICIQCCKMMEPQH